MLELVRAYIGFQVFKQGFEHVFHYASDVAEYLIPINASHDCRGFELLFCLLLFFLDGGNLPLLLLICIRGLLNGFDFGGILSSDCELLLLECAVLSEVFKHCLLPCAVEVFQLFLFNLFCDVGV